jgi:hypothetical protein
MGLHSVMRERKTKGSWGIGEIAIKPFWKALVYVYTS